MSGAMLSPRYEALHAKIAGHFGARLARSSTNVCDLGYVVEPDDLIEVCEALRDEPDFKFEMLMDVCGVDYLGYGRDEWHTHEASGTGFSRGVDRPPAGIAPALPAMASAPSNTGPGGPGTAPAGAVPAGATAPSGVSGHLLQTGAIPGEAAVPSLRAEEAEFQPPRRFAVAYQLMSITHNHRLRLKAFCADDSRPIIDSVCGVWASADWFEREAFDLFGILFRGHPDLRRLLTDYGFIGHPFRKDFPLIGKVEMRYDPAKGRVVYEPVSIEPRTLVPKVIRDDHRYEPLLKDSGDA
jgi:NADH-quinone oxidoreductase subunit C